MVEAVASLAAAAEAAASAEDEICFMSVEKI